MAAGDGDDDEDWRFARDCREGSENVQCEERLKVKYIKIKVGKSLLLLPHGAVERRRKVQQRNISKVKLLIRLREAVLEKTQF